MFMIFRLEKLFAFGKFLRFLLHDTSDVTRGARSTIPGRGITAGEFSMGELSVSAGGLDILKIDKNSTNL